MNRSGPLDRVDGVAMMPVSLVEGSAVFNFVVHGCTNSVVVPFVDVLAIYKDLATWTVRVTGVIRTSNRGAEYVPLG
jgi:hypothetical protein